MSTKVCWHLGSTLAFNTLCGMVSGFSPPPLSTLINLGPKRCSRNPLLSAPSSGPRPSFQAQEWSCLLSSHPLDRVIPAHSFNGSLHTDKTQSPTSSFNLYILTRPKAYSTHSSYFHFFVREKKTHTNAGHLMLSNPFQTETINCCTCKWGSHLSLSGQDLSLALFTHACFSSVLLGITHKLYVTRQTPNV